MSTLSLGVAIVSKLLSNKLTESDIQYYKTNKREFKCMWSKLSNGFWIKYILICKEVLGKSYEYKKCTELDQSFIELLDVLVCVDYNSVFSLIEHNGKLLCKFTYVSEKEETKLLSRMSIDVLAVDYVKKRNMFQSIAGFIRLLPIWQNCSSSSNTSEANDWDAPAYWDIESSENSLELYIKSKWHIAELIGIFHSSVEHVPLLNNERFNSELSKNVEEICLDEHIEISTLENKRNVSKGSNPPDSIKPIFGWIPVVKTSKRNPRYVTECGNQELLRQSNNNVLRIWELVEVSIPHILHKRYSAVNIMSMIENETSCHFMGVCVIFSIWDETFGLQLLCKINEKSTILQKLCKTDTKIANGEWKYSKSNKKVKEWRERVDELLTGIDRARQLIDKPIDNDIAKSSLEFLLETNVIIHLPWNCTLLHQWLASALMEVLIFEHKSIELRHWPMPKSVINLASELLSLVKNLKERIILGFAILSRQTTIHPNINRQFPRLLMEHVIIPSLSILQFLITGKAFQILRNIKVLSWKENKNMNNMMYISSSTYTIDSKLEYFYSKLCYNFMYWEYLILPQPFPGYIITELDIKHIITKINTKNTPKTNNNETIKPFSKEEQLLCLIVEKNREAVTNSERLKLIIKFIKENIIDLERIENISMNQITEFVQTKKMNKLSGIVFQQKEITIENHIILCSMIHNELYGMLLGSEKENSILANIVNKQLEILEREQIIRITNLLSIKYNVNPIAIGINTQDPMSLEKMLSYISDVQKRQKLQNYNWLLQQFPENWQDEIDGTNVMFRCMGNSSNRLYNMMCIERIGKLIYNISKNAFDVYEKTGVYFKHITLIQYIIPCYLASFIFSMNSPRDSVFKTELAFAFQTFINESLSKIEEKFADWEIGNDIKPLVHMKIFENEKIVTGLIGELLTLGEYHRNLAHNIFKVNIAEQDPSDNEKIGMFGLTNMHLGLQEWTNALISDIHGGEGYKEIVPFVITWSVSALEFFKTIYDISYTSWPAPELPLKLNNQKLIDMFTSDLAMQGMELVFQIMKGYKSDEDNITASTIMLHLKVYAMKTKWADDSKLWRYKILKAINDNEKTITIADNDYYNETIEFFIDFYEALKIYRSTNKFPIELNFLHLFPQHPPQVKQAIQLFVKGDLKQLDKMMPLLPQNQRNKKEQHVHKQTQPGTSKQQQITKQVQKPTQQTEQCMKSPERPVKPSEQPQKQPQKKKKVKKQCKMCGKYDSKRISFIVCQKCIKDNYPDINYYCGTHCRDAWWKEEHMAEHLEFELGLGEFAHVNGNK